MTRPKRALITGITGQDGSYLAELLIDKGYEVHGIVRRSSSLNRGRIDHLFDPNQSERSHFLHYGDLTDASSLNRLLREIKPDEIYNLGAQSHVKVSFEIPEYTADTVALGTLRLLEGIRESGLAPRIYQAGSSEMYGLVQEMPQRETTPFYPRSPYAAAKVYAHWVAVNYREAYGMFVCNGILFNHESPRRGENFVSRKISRGVAAIKLGLQHQLALGNLEAKRDWGYAKDYVVAMWQMLQHDKPDDYVVATGEMHTVRDFCELAFRHAGLDWRDHVVVDPRYFRPTEVDVLLGDASHAKKVLGWQATTRFEELVKLMVDADIALLRGEPHAIRSTVGGGKQPWTEAKECRICGSHELRTVLDLGRQTLTGVFPPSADVAVSTAPLELVKCHGEGSCGLVQLKHSCDPSQMYGANYGYRSSLNRSMVEHLKQKATGLQWKVKLGAGDVVLDIGSNDGTSLSFYPDSAKRVGIDPTAAKFAKYYQPNITVVPEFFTADAFLRATGGERASLVTSIAMLYDLERPMDFVRDVHEILKEGGTWHFEQSYLPSMLRTWSYDTVCHEHLEYYGLTQIQWMMQKVGFRIVDVTLNDINGGSFAVTVVKASAAELAKEPEPVVAKMLDEERAMGLHTLAPYEKFAAAAAKHKEDLVALLHRLKKDGKRVLGMGASTKGNVLLQYCGIGPDLVEAIAEVNEDKFGHVTPGSRIPIISEADAEKRKPDFYLVLPWHFRENLMKRATAITARGAKFLFPLPRIEILPA